MPCGWAVRRRIGNRHRKCYWATHELSARSTATNNWIQSISKDSQYDACNQREHKFTTNKCKDVLTMRLLRISRRCRSMPTRAPANRCSVVASCGLCPSRPPIHPRVVLLEATLVLGMSDVDGSCGMGCWIFLSKSAAILKKVKVAGKNNTKVEMELLF